MQTILWLYLGLIIHNLKDLGLEVSDNMIFEGCILTLRHIYATNHNPVKCGKINFVVLEESQMSTHVGRRHMSKRMPISVAQVSISKNVSNNVKQNI